MRFEDLSLNDEKVQGLRDQVRRLKKGLPGALSSGATDPGSISESSGAPKSKFMIGMGQQMAAFFVALGLITAVQLQFEYSENPAAWASYLDNSFTPAGILPLVAFLGAAGGTYWAGQKFISRVYGEAALQKVGPRFGLYGTSLAAGIIASTVLADLMADPNAGQCTGYENFRTQGRWEMNLQACDSLWETWSSNPHWNRIATEQILPMFANIIVAGGLLAAAEKGLTFLLSRTFVINGLQKVGMGFSQVRGGPWMMLIGRSARLALFFGAYEISDKVFNVGRGVREFFAADWSFSNDPLGSSLFNVQNNILTEWGRLKRTDFQQYDLPKGSDQPLNLSFLDLIQKYGKSQNEWRKLQMTEVDDAYRQWRVKSDYFYAMQEISSDFYRESMKRIAAEMKEADPKKKKEVGFSQEFVDRYVAQKEQEDDPAWKSLSKRWYSDNWKYVYTPKLADYLVASMACGPEIEGYGENAGVWRKTQEIWSSWFTANTNPQNMIDDKSGFSINLNPPRIVKPIDSNQGSVCQKGIMSDALLLGPSTQLPPSNFPVSTASGSYRSLYDYIKSNIRPSLLQQGEIQFDSWWKRLVLSKFQDTEKRLRSDYENLLKTVYRETLTRHDYYGGCGPSDVSVPSLERALGDIPLIHEDCPADASRRLARGILNSLRDEMRLYMALRTDLYLSNMNRLGTIPPEEIEKARQEINSKSSRILEIMEKYYRQTLEIDRGRREDLSGSRDEFLRLSKELKVMMVAPGDDDDNPYGYLEQWAYVLGTKIDGIMGQVNMLLNILSKFESSDTVLNHSK